MSDTQTPTSTPAPKLWSLQIGETFDHRGREFVLTGFGRTNAKIALVSDPTKLYNLSMEATVTRTGRNDDALAAALKERTVDPTSFRVGDKVRFMSNAQTRKAGLAGTETVVVKVNQKTVGLANGYRVGPSFLEAV